MAAKPCGRVSNMRICLAMALVLIAAACSPRDKALVAGRTAYEHGDYLAAYEILHPLADHDEPEAQFLIGQLFYAGKGGWREDRTAAVQWYRRAAEQGFAKAEYAFGWSLFFDEGVPKGTPERQRSLAAARWMRKAADQNFAPAQSFLG